MANTLIQKKTRLTPYNVIMSGLLLFISFTFIFPFYWIATGSFKASDSTYLMPPEWFPANPILDNYVRLMKNPALNWFLNSLVMSLASMAIICVVASLAGYVLAKKRFPGRNLIFTMFVAAMALPKQVVLIPLVRMMNMLGIYDTLWAVIFPSVAWPFGIFLMKQFSESIPGEMLEAARIDGAGEMRTFLSIVAPMIKPAFGALAIFTFISVWNDYSMQLMMLTSRRNLSISLGIATLQAENATDYGLLMAGATLGSVPIVLIFVLFQNYFTQGIALGAVKG